MADRLLTINIRKYLVTQPRTKRARKAAKYIKDRVAHYTKIKPENVKMSAKLNELIFKQYSRRMVPVKVRVKIGTDTADILPFAEEAAGKVQESASKKEEKKEEKKGIRIVKNEPKKAEEPKPVPKSKQTSDANKQN